MAEPEVTLSAPFSLRISALTVSVPDFAAGRDTDEVVPVGRVAANWLLLRSHGSMMSRHAAIWTGTRCAVSIEPVLRQFSLLLP